MLTIGLGFAMLAPACPAGGEAVVIQETVIEHPWRYVTEDPAETYFALVAWQRPFLGGEGDRLGYFTHDWDVALRLDGATKMIAKACFVTRFEMHYPYMPTPTLRRCYGDVTDQAEAHERRHVEITAGVIEETAAALIGATREEAAALTDGLEAKIEAANEAFHETPEGRAQRTVRRRSGC